MNKIVDWIKGCWKVILIILLSIMFISKCTSTNNFERKFHKEQARVEYVTDSLSNMYSNSAKHIDSLNRVIKEKNAEINSLTKQLNIYVEQNAQLNDRNKALANKPVVVNIENKKDNE